MKAFALVLISVLTASGCKSMLGHSIQGSGVVGTRTVSVGAGKTIAGFKGIRTNGSFDIDVEQGPQSDVTITGDDNLVQIVDLKVEGDTLVVGTSKGFSSDRDLKLSVRMPVVESIEINGSGDVLLSKLYSKNTSLTITGSGSFKATGSAERLEAEINGSGEMDATGVASEEVDASISGSGSIYVNAIRKLDADISGSGSIRYTGSPRIDKQISGSGSVEPAKD